MTQSPNPSIVGGAIIKALDSEVVAAGHGDASADQAALDETDLREVEHAEYYTDTPGASASAVPAPRKTLLDRLLRR